MKYELNEYHRNTTDEEFLNDMKRVAKSLGKEAITIIDYSSKGKYHPSTIGRRFGGWRNACLLAGLKLDSKQTHSYVELSLLIDDIKRVAIELSCKTLTASIYETKGKYERTTIIRRAGSWNNALRIAGLDISFNRDFSEEEMLIDIENIWIKLGRQPTSTDIKNGISKFSLQSYARRFGGWRGALEAFVEYINKDDEESNTSELNEKSDIDSTDVKTSDQFVHKTKRDINLRLRFKVMQRDNFKCCACGTSPAKDTSVELHIDHIVPWSKGGETVIENLQTLCSNCNLGKSDLF